MSKLTMADFEIERLLGEGNMSRVFEARIKSTNELVALKLVDKNQIERLAKRLEVLMEKHCLITLNKASYRDLDTAHAFPKTIARDESASPVIIGEENHSLHGLEHICQLYHTFVTESDVALVLELCSGQELWDAVKCIGIADHETFCEIWLQIEEALSAIHSHNIVHRDVKAENIVFRSDGILKFADFGTAYDLTLPYKSTLAGTRGRCRAKTRTFPARSSPLEGDEPSSPASRPDLPPSALYFYVGTPNFMAPESRQNHPEKDCRIDIWSLGCLLYQIATGSPPFQAPSEFLVYIRAQNHDLDIPCFLRPDYLDYIELCLRDDIHLRPSWEELKEKTFTKQAQPCCRRLRTGGKLLGDQTAIQILLRRRAVFYSSLIIEYIKRIHPSEFPNPEDIPKSPRPTNNMSSTPPSSTSMSQNLKAPNTLFSPRRTDLASPRTSGDSPVGSSDMADELSSVASGLPEPDWKLSVLPYLNSPITPVSPPDVAWLRELYPWLGKEEVVFSCLVKGDACVKAQKLVDAYALTPGAQIWREIWTRLELAVTEENDCKEFCALAASAASSDDVRDIISKIPNARANLDSLVRCSFHALRELCTRERADNLYENWAKSWAPPPHA